ncbi:MAG: RNA pseudouridine synthase [Saprospiraceae bacterium]|jgi:23S rRNA pseudouridine1911/1915/1917 synthase|nr:RNA pseudouridine synthase [Candidatus Brachybacter algidus]MBP9845898.1 RNA pseudouridine synthase [Saprospiraceae bacterium]MBK6448851.1 RNA pseudouridine synthase [Candidatus Brachybacter algidus]MBK7603761.1 RNA pseudouridine synthase [Candidatus Brachybacter algidus]MBK8357182.1 RNA pseudouridine synthase [Candidatus Brachybacter algidus]
MQFSEQVLVKNHQFCVINKLSGQPVQPDKTGDTSLLDMSEKYFHHKLYLVHRLDRPVSGLILLAKKPASAAQLSNLFKTRKVEKTYLALVEKEMPETEGTLIHQIDPSPKKNNKSHTKEDADADTENLAVTHYKVLGKTTTYTLVQLKPVTGKHHQIRAQLASVGCPIKGDVKYGARRGNKDRSISLHAWKLSFKHPVSNEENTFEAPLPEDSLWQACNEFINKK